MSRPVRRFTDRGVHAVHQLLDSLEAGDLPDHEQLLEDEELSEFVAGADGAPIEIEVRPFSDRRDAATYLLETLAPLETYRAVERDRGLWTWLGIAWLDVLAPIKLGSRRLGEQWRWVLAVDDYRKYSRHLLAGPFFIAQAHRDNLDRAMAVLVTQVDRPGEIVAQLATRNDIVRSPGIMEAASRLYVDPESATGFRSGAGGRGGGSARRLAEVLMQFELTWDVVGMPADELLDLLPDEFDRFRAR